MSTRMALTQLAPGRPAVVVEVQGGHGLVRRLEAIGIRVGQKVEAVSGPFMRGPVTVRAGNVRVAIGFGAARKVFVETGEPQP